MGVKVVASAGFSIGLAIENQRMRVQRKRRFLSLEETQVADTMNGNL